MSKVSSGNKPVKKFYKLAGMINEGANICLISTCIDMNFNTAKRTPPMKSCIITVALKNEVLDVFIA
jgi:hypothetical protein